MPWTDEQKKFCYYVIATVETGCDYGATNSSDAITLGIAQWYGTRAAALLTRLQQEVPGSYAVLSQRIRDAHASADTNWTRFYLELTDQQSWRAASEIEGNHALQDDQFYRDLEDYIDTLSYWGVDTDNVKSTIFYISMYHQSPQGCLTIVQNYGGNRDVGTLFNAAMNSQVFGLYKNRYATVRDLLNGWDGASDPPDFGQTDPSTPQEPTEPVDPVESAVSYIQAVGNDLIVFGKGMSSTSRLVCRNTGRGIWIPVGGTLPDNPGTTVPDPEEPGGIPGGGDPADFAGMKQLWIDNDSRWAYSNASGRLDPPSSGYSDCSACIWWAANAATNNKYSWLGTRSYTIPDTCYYVRDLDWTQPELDISDWIAGDILCMNYNIPGVYSGGHAEWYFGNGDLWSAGYAPLPKQEEFGTVASRYYRMWQNGTTFNWLKLCRFL